MTNKKEATFQITAPHFCAGGKMEFRKTRHYRGEWVCVEAAPIIKYMVGWTNKKIKDCCDHKGWTCVTVAMHHG